MLFRTPHLVAVFRDILCGQKRLFALVQDTLLDLYLFVGLQKFYDLCQGVYLYTFIITKELVADFMNL